MRTSASRSEITRRSATERFFDLPKDCHAKKLSVILHVDNDAAVFLNGVQFGSTPLGQLLSNFQGAPEGPFTTTGPFKEAGNLLEFRRRWLSASSRVSTMRPP